MEVLNFQEIIKIDSETSMITKPAGAAGVTSDVSVVRILRPTLIADVMCSSITGSDTGCCKSQGCRG